MSQKIKCEVCGGMTHSIHAHLKSDHPEMTVAEYQEKFPTAPLLSDAARQLIEKKEAEKLAAAAASTAPVKTATTSSAPLSKSVETYKKAFHEVFALGSTKAAKSAKGDPIPITVVSKSGNPEMVPSVSEDYVYNVDELKNVILAMENFLGILFPLQHLAL